MSKTEPETLENFDAELAKISAEYKAAATELQADMARKTAALIEQHLEFPQHILAAIIDHHVGTLNKELGRS